jgi:hypothetical protein
MPARRADITSAQEGNAMKRRQRTLVQFPITEDERRALKHQAIDQGVTLGEIVRKALGFSMTMNDAMTGTGTTTKRGLMGSD